MPTERLLSTDEAASRLGVKRETLYAYVSRGLISSQRGVDGRSYFDADKVDALAARGRGGTGAAGSTLTIESSVSTVRDDRLSYRGHDTVELARSWRFEDVAELLWRGTLRPTPIWTPDPDAVAIGRRAAAALPDDAGLVARLRVVAVALGEALPASEDDIDTARRLLASMVATLPRLGNEESGDLAGALWARLSPRPPDRELLRALDAALVLAADHGLIRSTLTARIVANSGGSLADSVLAALGVAATASVRSSALGPSRRMLAEIQAGADPDDLLDGAPLPHTDRRYPDGDPRADAVLILLPDGPHVSLVGALQHHDDHPSADVALAALAHAGGMVREGGETIALVARMAGWLAHAMEERRRPTGLRISEVYTGPEPEGPRPRRMLDAVQDYLSR